MNSSGKSTIIIGLFIIISGVLLLLNNLGLTDISSAEVFRTYWPIILIVWGFDVFKKDNNINRSHFILSILTIILGLLLLGRNLDFFAFDLKIIWQLFWPLVFILLGFSIIKGSTKTKGANWAIMSGFEKKNTNWTLKNENYIALMGGIELDLSVADIPEKETHLDLTAVMGGIDIKVPKDMNIIANGICLLGGIDFMNDDAGGLIATRKFEHKGEPENKKLIISYRTLMGGIDIKGI